MRSPGRPGINQQGVQREFWKRIAEGMQSEQAALACGVSTPVGTRWFRDGGGMSPISLAEPSGRYLSVAEREEIAILKAQRHGVREIARRLDRHPSTISRELRRNAATRGGKLEYRATTAQWKAERAARRPKVPGIERVVGVGMDSTERGIDPVLYRPAFQSARAAGFRLTAHPGENSPPAAIAACIDVLAVERIDHGLSSMQDAELVARVAAARIPLTVCPTSNLRIANAFARLEDHIYPQMRAAGLLATLNTDDPALIELDLGTEYRSVADTFGWGWQEMVTISLDGVEASWLDETGKADLRQRITQAATALTPDEQP
jgi:adenosine deaminase